jgi:hypothetical protein
VKERKGDCLLTLARTVFNADCLRFSIGFNADCLRFSIAEDLAGRRKICSPFKINFPVPIQSLAIFLAEVKVPTTQHMS